MKWIPVKKKLPDNDRLVPIWVGHLWLGTCDGGVWRDLNGIPATVTHWAEMPAGPGKKGKAK